MDNKISLILKMIEAFSNTIKPMIDLHSQVIARMGAQLKQVMARFKEREKGRLPPQSEPNPYSLLGGASTLRADGGMCME
jgi:uncharacterized coiled-coil protein SlyX